MRIFSAVFAAAVLAAGSLAGFAEPVSIEIGMLGASAQMGAEEWLMSEIAAFQKANPDVAVSTLALASPRKLERSLLTMPAFARNIIGVDSWQGYEAAWLASRGLIVPIDQFLPDPELSLEVFPANLFDPVKFGGKIWGVPWCTEHMLLACNWPLFEEAGIGEPPKTWDELFAYAQKLTKDTNGDGKTDQWGIFTGTYDYVGFLAVTLLLQKDAYLFNKTGIDFSSPAVPEVLGVINQWIASGVFTAGIPAGEHWAMGFLKQDSIRDIDKNYRLAPMPTWGRRTVCNNGTAYFVIRKSTPEQEKAAWRFVKWMSRRDVSMPKHWAGYPCRTDFPERADFQAIKKDFCGNLELLYTQNAFIQDIGPANLINRNVAIEHVVGYLSRALTGEVDFPTVMASAAQEANQLIQVIPDPADAALNLYK